MERKLARQDDLWYQLGHRRAENGAPAVRIWTVECHKCERTHTLTPGSSSDEGIRKALIRSGWDLGRRFNQHLCPICTGAVKLPSPVTPPPVTPQSDVLFPVAEKEEEPFLVEAWRTCNSTEQDDFLKWLAANVPGVLQTIGLLALQPRPSLRDVWDSMPEADRERWLHKQRPPPPIKTLRELWNDSHLDDQSEFLSQLWSEFGHNLVKWVSFTAMWAVAQDQQRQQFLGYLRAAGLMTVTIAAAAPTVKLVAGQDYMKPADTSIVPTNTRRVIEAGTISKSEFARELGIRPATVTGYLTRGMPERPDKRLDGEVVRAWVKNNIHQSRKSKQMDISGETLAFDDDDAIAALRKKLFG